MKTKFTYILIQRATLWLLLSTLNPQLSTVFAQGSLTPPGPPGPMMKTLAQIEPRTPISSLPFFITNAGSYYVTTNLTGQPGITILTNGVTLDLMGFELVGGGGSGVAIASGQTSVCVRNGTLRNWSGNGVSADSAVGCRFEGLRLVGNRNLAGISVGRGCLVLHCVALNNNDTGIEARAGSLISHCIAWQNRVGISVAQGSRVSDCTSVSNSFIGIFATLGSTVSDCTVSTNVGDGIYVVNGCRIAGNHCYANGSAGIRVTAIENSIEGNALIDNQRGIWIERVDGRKLVVRNVARNNFLSGVGNRNYEIATGNRVAQTVILPLNGVALAGETGGNASGTTDPWSNISY